MATPLSAIADVTAFRQATLDRISLERARDRASLRLRQDERAQLRRDDIQDFYQAKALQAQVSRLLETKSNTEQAIQTLQATQAGLDAAGRLSDQLQGLALAAQDASSAEQRAELARQFDQVASQLDNLVADTSYRGTNLLSIPADDLRVSVSPAPGPELTVQGRPSDAASLGLGSATTDYNNFATQTDIDAALSAVQSAGSTLQASASAIGINAGILEVRSRFNQDLADVTQTGADRLTASDPYESAAALQATQALDGLAIEGQRIAARSQNLIVDLVTQAGG
ncbi:hypothetical protein JCM17960_23000 [Magnetospira thiophila]